MISSEVENIANISGPHMSLRYNARFRHR
jgi:hypothetical protein